MERMPEDTPSGIGCCGVATTAMIAGVSFNYAWKTLRKIKNAPPNWKGSSRATERGLALTKLGVTYEDWFYPSKGPTIGQWIRGVDTDGKTFEVITTGHAQVVKDNLIFDQDNPWGVPIGEFKKRRKHVKMVREIK